MTLCVDYIIIRHKSIVTAPVMFYAYGLAENITCTAVISRPRITAPIPTGGLSPRQGRGDTMKKIDNEEIMHIATLSRLRFTDEETEEIGKHLDSILEKFRALDAVDVSGIPPTAHILPYTNVLREDVPSEPMPRAELLKNAPETDGEAYIVKRVVE